MHRRQTELLSNTPPALHFMPFSALSKLDDSTDRAPGYRKAPEGEEDEGR
jgi:hypothetical protein